MSKKSTQLRYACSTDPQLLVSWVNSLPFKIEIKGNPLLKGNKFFLFFTLIDQLPSEKVQLIGGDLDG